MKDYLKRLFKLTGDRLPPINTNESENTLNTDTQIRLLAKKSLQEWDIPP